MDQSYEQKLLDLRGGRLKDDVYMKGAPASRSRAVETRARAGKGQFHSYLSDLHNFIRDTESAIKRGDLTRAKELALRHIEADRNVRSGKIAEVTEKRAAKAEAQTIQRKTVAVEGEKAEITEAEQAKAAFEEGAGKIAEEEARTTRVKSIAELKRTGLGVPTKDKFGRLRFLEKDVDRERDYVGDKPEEANPTMMRRLTNRADAAAREKGRILRPEEFAEIASKTGNQVYKGTFGDLLTEERRPGPDRPIERQIYDVVRDIAKDIPVQVWSRTVHDAYDQHIGRGAGKSRAWYSPGLPMGVFRTDTTIPRTVFHEALHAATSRALRTSPRLEKLITQLQGIIERRYRSDLDVMSDRPFQLAIRNAEGKAVIPQEFITELFTRPEVRDLVEGVHLTPMEVRAITRLGYRADIGQSLLRSLWHGLLKTLGFKAETPNAYKAAIDVLEDAFRRERGLQARDLVQDRPLGQMFTGRELENLRMQDAIGEQTARAIRDNDFATAASGLMDIAHRLDEKTAEKAVSYLEAVNDRYYEREGWEKDVTLESNTPEQVQSGVAKFLGDKFGERGKDAAFQFEQKFGTALRHFTQGMRYTEDLGNNLEQGFRDAIHPIKQAWAKREHYAQKYMDVSGANKLIDDIATMKNAIKDRNLWTDFQNLLSRESNNRTYADEELGVGRNEHINTGDLRDYQSSLLHKENQKLLNSIRDRNPELIKLRDRIFEFEKKELNARQQAKMYDMLVHMKILDPKDVDGRRALIKNIRDQDSTMTDAERRAFHRLTGDADSPEFKEWIENRKTIRNMTSAELDGPHVPFMRRGSHAVSARYFVKPNEGVKYNEVTPEAKDDLHRAYDFAQRSDAENFIRNVLNHERVQLTQTGGGEIVYDLRTGQRAMKYTPEEMKKFEEGPERPPTNRYLTPDDIKEEIERDPSQAKNYEVRHRVEFNPTEFVKFENERLAQEYRNKINVDIPESDPLYKNFHIEASHVETPHDMVQPGNAPYVSAELQRWINRIEASPAYQKMTGDQRAEWRRELQEEAARATQISGRRSMFLPREYVKGQSTDILKNMIESSGASARAIASNIYNPEIVLAKEKANEYVHRYRYGAGGEEMGKSHRARDDVMKELDRRLHAPIRVEDSWATGIKRALQVSMISHLADISYLVVNAIEPWVFGAAITASRHGWAGSYRELARATKLVNPLALAAEAGREMGASFWGKFRGESNYEEMLLRAVSKEADGARLAQVFNNHFDRGLVARDAGMEVARIHDPSSNVLFRGMDYMDNLFRGANTSVEILNRSISAISNYRLEFAKVHPEILEQMRRDPANRRLSPAEIAAKAEAQAHAQAIRYSEEQVFKGAGDYAAWNTPRYMNNPFLKLATQFKKYPLRIASVYADAIVQAVRGDKQAMKQVAYMLATQGLASGALGLTVGPFAGTVNAAYLLGLSDSNWSDYEFAMRKYLVDQIGVEGADLVLRGGLNFTGADFSSRTAQNSLLWFGSPESRRPQDVLATLGKTLLGAPGDMGAKFYGGIQKGGEAVSHFRAGANSKGWASALESADGVLPIKFVHDIMRAGTLALQGPAGMPKGNEATTGQAIVQALGFTPTEISKRQEERRVTQRLRKQESAAHSLWTGRYVDADTPAEKRAVWESIQKNYNPTVDPKLRITYSDLWKAQQRKKSQERRDERKLGVPLSGRQKVFADTGKYFSTD